MERHRRQQRSECDERPPPASGHHRPEAEAGDAPEHGVAQEPDDLRAGQQRLPAHQAKLRHRLHDPRAQPDQGSVDDPIGRVVEDATADHRNQQDHDKFAQPLVRRGDERDREVARAQIAQRPDREHLQRSHRPHHRCPQDHRDHRHVPRFLVVQVVAVDHHDDRQGADAQCAVKDDVGRHRRQHNACRPRFRHGADREAACGGKGNY